MLQCFRTHGVVRLTLSTRDPKKLVTYEALYNRFTWFQIPIHPNRQPMWYSVHYNIGLSTLAQPTHK